LDKPDSSGVCFAEKGDIVSFVLNPKQLQGGISDRPSEADEE
jgi:hypothetical protein